MFHSPCCVFRVPCSLIFLMFPLVFRVPYAPWSLLRVPRSVFCNASEVPAMFLVSYVPLCFLCSSFLVAHSGFHVPQCFLCSSHVPCSLRSTDLVACSTLLCFSSDDPCSLSVLMFPVLCVPHFLFRIQCSIFLNGSDHPSYVPCFLRSTNPVVCSTFRVL
jgi:hypothetical protein